MKKEKFNPFVVRCVKNNEEDKYIVVCGEFLADPMMYDTQESAEATLKRYENLPWEAIGAYVYAILRAKDQIIKDKIETK